MFRHHLLLAVRSFKRHKSSFFINLIGLSTALAAGIAIYLWVLDEISYDRFHKNQSRLYQVMRNLTQESGEIQTFDGNSDLLAPALKEEMPEVEHVVSVSRAFADGILAVGDENYNATGKFVGKEFFQIFSYPLIIGSPITVFSDKYSIVISDVLANRLFGNTKDVLGKIIFWDQELYKGPYQVSGVFGSGGYNTSDKFDFLLNNQVYLDHAQPYWDNNNVQTYLTFKEGISVESFNAKIKNFVRNKFKALYGSEHLHFIANLFVRPYSDKYLFNHYQNGVQSGGRIDYLVLFSMVAGFILIIACVNFMNLSTAQASKRLKEVGVKKAVGVGRKTLIFQYLGESTIIAFISLLAAILMVFMLLPKFNQITGKDLSLSLDPGSIVGILMVTLLTGLISGSYPAIYLSGFRTSQVLKGKITTSLSELWMRRGLVVFQFTVSILLMVAVLVVYQQMDYIQSKNLGYVKDNVLIFRSDGKMQDLTGSFLTAAKQIPGVVNASAMGNNLGFPGGTGAVEWEGKTNRVEFNVLEAGYDLLELLEITVGQGRSFSKDFSSDSTKLILNETAVQSMGLVDPVGKTIKLWHQKYQIIGIVKDFYFESLYESIKPCIIRLIPPAGNILIKVQRGVEKETVQRLEDHYHQYNPGVPFNFSFLDDEYNALYLAEQRVADLSYYFAGIAIILSCLGLFGLASFSTEKRLKEIGIRKVLGSSAFEIVQLLSRDFTKMVVTALLIGLPASYVLAKLWLDNFAYHIELEWWYFMMIGLSALLIAWLTVGLKTVRSAQINPVECLKEE